MQAIETKYHGPTDRQGSRVSATAEAGRVVLEWDHALNSERNHMRAAAALARKLGWVGPAYAALYGGQLKSGQTVWVFADDQSAIELAE